jgi:hypothetical protein
MTKRSCRVRTRGEFLTRVLARNRCIVWTSPGRIISPLRVVGPRGDTGRDRAVSAHRLAVHASIRNKMHIQQELESTAKGFAPSPRRGGADASSHELEVAGPKECFDQSCVRRHCRRGNSIQDTAEVKLESNPGGSKEGVSFKTDGRQSVDGASAGPKAPS